MFLSRTENATQFGSVLTSGYRGDGLRAWKDNGTSAAPNRTYYLYDSMTPVAELDASGNVLATNTFGANGLAGGMDATQQGVRAVYPYQQRIKAAYNGNF